MQEVGPDQSGEHGRTRDGALCGLSHAQQQEGDEGYSDLDADGILGGADEARDLEGLLDPTEEQFDGPASAVEFGDLLGAGIEVVGQDTQHLSGLGRDADLAYRVLHWIVAVSRLACWQEADAVGEDIAAGCDRQFLHHFERGVGFEAGDDAATGSVERGQKA